jgi:hypothetical protein
MLRRRLVLRSKDTTKKGEALATANFVQKGNPLGKNKGNFKPSFNKPIKTTTFKKKKPNRDRSDLTCFTCGEPGHFSKDCPDHADRRGKKAKTINVVTAGNIDGYGKLFIVLSVFPSPSWWIDTGTNVYVCADISMFTSYQAAQDSSILMGNGSHASVRGVGTVDLKFTSGKIVQLRNVQHLPTMNKNLVSGSLLCRDRFKVVLESNKVVVSKHG